jgi:Right handed beta helix region
MPLNFRMPRNVSKPFATTLVALAAAFAAHGGAAAAAAPAAVLPAAPKTFDSSYVAPTGATLTVGAGDNLQTALDQAQLGDTIVLQAGATFTGPFKLPNKTSGSGWIYVVSSKLASLPPAGQRVGPKDAVNMARILAPAYINALQTVVNSHHFRFVGIEFAPVAHAAEVYELVAIGNANTSPDTLPHHIIFDRCYVHGVAGENTRRGIEMDGAYVAVVDSYISDFQELGTDSQGLWAYNTTGPLQIVDDYIEAATENVLFGGTDSRSDSLVPADIEIRNNYFFKPLSLIGTKYPMKNLLEFKAALRVIASGNTFVNNPAGGQSGFAILVTPRNQSGTAPWTATDDIAITGNTLINVGSGFNLAGHDWPNTSQRTARLLIRDNVIGVTALNGADGRAFEVTGGGSDYTIDHNTVINTAPSGPTVVMMAANAPGKTTNFVFTNNLSSPTKYGFFGANVGSGTPALNNNFTNWVFEKNVFVDAPAKAYPADNFFPPDVAAVRFANFAAANYALAPGSPYKSAGTDGGDIGADVVGNTAVAPAAPTNVAVK